MVQDLATQWIQSFPCRTKTSQETERSFTKVPRAVTEANSVMYTDISLEFVEACEELSWDHCTSTPHCSETNGFAERAVRRIKEGTSAVLLQSGLDENGGRTPWNVSAICEIFKISCLTGRHHMKGGS